MAGLFVRDCNRFSICPTERQNSSRSTELLFHEFTRLAVPENSLQDYRLLAVDGSDLRLPSNSNDGFSSIRNSEDSKNYNLVHLDAMYDLIGKVYVNASVQPKKGMNEHKALLSMVDQSEISGNVIAIMDRGYESFNNIAHFQEKSWYYIIRAKESYGIISRLSLPDCPEYDEEIMLTLTRRQTKETLSLLKAYPHRYRWIQPHTTFDFIKPKDSKFYDLHFRAVRFAIADGVYEAVYTNLNAEDFPPEKIKQFYNLSWGIETSFKELKYAVGLASLHSKKKDFILQEIFAN
ncbi:IS4 family transposase [Desulfosporosinus sp. BG]|uniref:IS4 family transposase n=1 Tax=Desulfosporosinus sp. BG TaxID=1633135 RepID=UPI001FA72ED8|nr:IS4 family transposase [Desulfosporosinus sp. BG]